MQKRIRGRGNGGEITAEKLLQMENGIYHAQTQRPDFEFSPNIEPGGWDLLQ